MNDKAHHAAERADISNFIQIRHINIIRTEHMLQVHWARSVGLNTRYYLG